MSSISISSLEKFLSKLKIVATRYFVDSQRNLLFMEVFILKNLNFAFISISNKQKIKISQSENVLFLTEIKLNDRGDVIDEYLDKKTILNEMQELEFNSSKSMFFNIEKKLEENYNRPIDLSKTGVVARELLRQVRRLGICLQTTQYKPFILTKNIIVTIDSKNKSKLYEVTFEDSHTDSRLFSVCFTLELLLENKNNIVEDLSEIQSSLFKILSLNINKHFDILMNNMVDKLSLLSKKNLFTEKNSEYNFRLAEVEKFLLNELSNEKKLDSQIADLEQKLLSTSTSSLTQNLERNRQVKPLLEQKKEIEYKCKDLTRNVMSIKLKIINLLLMTDSLTFDLLVLIESIKSKISNFTLT